MALRPSQHCLPHGPLASYTACWQIGSASHNALPEGTAHLFHGTHFDSMSMAEVERNAKPVRL